MDNGAAGRQRQLIKDSVRIYYAAHPGSPANVRRPQITRRDGTWIVTLGSSGSQRIVGLGRTVEEALGAFDTEYLNYLRPISA